MPHRLPISESRDKSSVRATPLVAPRRNDLGTKRFAQLTDDRAGDDVVDKYHGCSREKIARFSLPGGKSARATTKESSCELEKFLCYVKCILTETRERHGRLADERGRHLSFI